MSNERIHRPAVLILVGPSGSGKSTWAKEFVKDSPNATVEICSADDYHMVSHPTCDGPDFYRFDPTKAAWAHSQCFHKFLRNIVDPDLSYVIVDNTNMSKWERQNYIQSAVNAGCKVFLNVWRCTTVSEIKLCASRNQHSVPIGVVADMALRYDLDETNWEEGVTSVRFHAIQGASHASV